MLTIRQDQLDTFRHHHLHKFEDEMVEHSREFSPQLCKVLGDEQLRLALRSAIQRADGYGFTNRGSIRLFIEMTFLYGSAFDSDPQYQTLSEVLRDSDDQMDRAEQIYQSSLDYIEKVYGPDEVSLRNAFRELSTFAQRPLSFSFDNLAPRLVRDIFGIFPQKAAYLGDATLKVLIDEGITMAKRYGFATVRHTALMVLLMFMFGHGCDEDPLYPWISQTLRDKRIVDAPTKGQRLEKKALTWLEHVLAKGREETQR
jgi:hypothetical protein